MSGEAKFGHAFNLVFGMGALRLEKILKSFGSFETAWKLSPAETARGAADPDLEKILEGKKKIDPENEISQLEKEGISLLFRGDRDYPPLLLETPHPPSVLYCLGELPDFSAPAVAIVGTRKPTRYGFETARALSRDLAQAGILIVSGLALGVDAQAHKGALEAGGKTIAVLGSGLKQIYPLQNKGIAERMIKEGGAVVSEFPPMHPPEKWTFPQRNRIIAGLSRAVIVIEAPQKSGSLITARFGLDYNREIGAVPGEISSINSAGPNSLLKNGAALVSSAEDVLALLGLFSSDSSAIDKTGEDDEYLLDLLAEPAGAEILVAKSGLKAEILNQKLTILELAGKIKNVGGAFHRTKKIK
ncbi:MAG: DNA-protecting protein DprA [Candidatus Niyogibacteria bacterium]|nr:DNA-protecting protein DprA [Candidatus Niyogibacteria bacterium]